MYDNPCSVPDACLPILQPRSDEADDLLMYHLDLRRLLGELGAPVLIPVMHTTYVEVSRFSDAMQNPV